MSRTVTLSEYSSMPRQQHVTKRRNAMSETSTRPSCSALAPEQDSLLRVRQTIAAHFPASGQQWRWVCLPAPHYCWPITSTPLP